jgi:acylphosphatase
MDTVSGNLPEAEMDQDRVIACRLVISGRVQGVGFRDWLVKAARRVGLLGWVRNRLDGTVEAHVEGQQAQIDDLVKACRYGPMLAQVTGVDVTTVPPKHPEGFHRRPTG